jgi:hypothetical protein
MNMKFVLEIKLGKCHAEGKFPKEVTLEDLLTHGTYDPHRDEISITVKGVPFTYEVRRP